MLDYDNFAQKVRWAGVQRQKLLMIRQREVERTSELLLWRISQYLHNTSPKSQYINGQLTPWRMMSSRLLVELKTD